MGTLFVDKLDPQSGTSLELGSSGDTVAVNTGATTNLAGNVTLGASGKTITVPAGATITNNGTQTGFGGTNTALFKAYYTGNGSISALAVTKLVFNNEHFDSNNVYNTSTGKFTAPEAGTYFFLAQFYVGTALSTLQVRLYKNGSNLENIGFSGSGAGAVTGSTILSLAQNDYIEIYARSNDGNTIYGSTVSGELTRFEGYKLIT